MGANGNARTKRKLTGLGILCAALMIAISLVLRNQTGFLGEYVGDPLENHLGFCAYGVPFLAILASVCLLKGEPISAYLAHLGGYGLIVFTLVVVLGALPRPYSQTWGGDLGILLAGATVRLVGLPGLLLAAAFALAVAGWLIRNDPVAVWSARLSLLAARGAMRAGGAMAAGWAILRRAIDRQRLTRRTLLATPISVEPDPVPVAEVPRVEAAPSLEQAVLEVAGEPETAPEGDGEPPENAANTEEKSGSAPQKRRKRAKARWKLPPIELLETDKGAASVDSLQSFIDDQVKVIDSTLEAFRVEGKVVSVTAGARVILFEWQPAPGVKASRLEGLADDLALALKVERVRVVVPLPGKGTVGVEIPHPTPADVTLGSLLGGRSTPAGDLPLALGRSLTGEALFSDLVNMPHLLIAGTTGSGKSVCIHTVLMSLMMKRTPEELRILLIDPKRVELIAYRECPHLLCEVITDAKKAVAALRWLVGVMEERYRLLAQYGCRDLHVFNRMVKDEQGEVDLSAATDAVVAETGLPWIVVGIDELADLMVARPREVEDALQRLAQMARGVGIHLVVATQRPSVDVLTGVIKANLPSRLSFQVATRVDSRTILDSGGADQLLGRGDMLFSPAGAPAPTRAQGAFVKPAEVTRVLEFWSEQGAPEFLSGETAVEPWTEAQESGEDDDPLYEQAVALVIRTGEASVSQLQRRLSIGFARAGRLVDLMERRGVVGPKQGSKAREILFYQGDGGEGCGEAGLS